MQDPKVLDTALSTRIDLYRLFTNICNSVALNGMSSGYSPTQPVERHLSQIPPKPRQAFLLVALEGLSEDEMKAWTLNYIDAQAIPPARRSSRKQNGQQHERHA